MLGGSSDGVDLVTGAIRLLIKKAATENSSPVNQETHDGRSTQTDTDTKE